MSELFIKQELIKTLPQLDAILLDIDGVVLDVSRSYRVVIEQTTQFYATNILHLQGDEPFLQAAETEHFKLAGGFNDDTDLTNAAVALLVAKHAQSGASQTATLRAQEPGWAEYTREIKQRGGGLAAAEGLILDMLTPSQRRDFARGWNPKLVVQLFEEMYGGDEACQALYGFEPQHIHGEGFWKKETVLLDAALLSARLKAGVLTGRSRSEAKLALSQADLQERIPEEARVTPEDGVRKPDGRTLQLLAQRLNFRFGVYIGDTMDDLKAVQNYRELPGAGRAKILSCIVLSGPSGGAHRRLFLEAGAEIVAPDVNILLQYLGHVTGS